MGRKTYSLFSPSQISKMSESQIRKEYSRLRSVANKRIQRMQKAGLGKNMNKPFATIQQINESSKWNVASQLANVSTFLRSDRTTVSGEKRFIDEFKKNMVDKGYGSLVESNEDVYKMIDFMENMREQYGDKLFDSGDALDVLQETQRLNIPVEKVKENYDAFASNLSELENMETPKTKRTMSKAKVAKLIAKFLI